MKTLNGDGLLGRLGLATRSPWGAALAVPLGTFGLGLLVGVGIGFMLAPKAGRGLREDIRDRLRGVAGHFDPAGAPDGHSPSAATTSVGG